MNQPQILMTDIAFGESPRWHDGRLWFSDWAAHELIAVDLDGKHEVITRVESFPFCVDFSPDGTPLIVSAADRKLFRFENDTLVPYVDLSAISDKPWNDITLDTRGNIYVNNIGFQFPGEEFAPGIVALITPDGSLRQVADGFAFPNGMVVTNDDSTLIVAESYAHQLTAFDIADDGTLSNRRVWADLGPNAYPDGICMDDNGAVWYADVPNKHCVRVAAGGQVLQTISADRGCFACELGGPDGRTLFIVATEWQGPQSTMSTERSGQVLYVHLDS